MESVCNCKDVKMERDYFVGGACGSLSCTPPSEMWPRIQTPPEAFSSFSTPCLVQSDFTLSCWCCSKITSQTMTVEMTIICGEKNPTNCPKQVLNWNHRVCRVCCRNQPLGGAEDTTALGSSDSITSPVLGALASPDSSTHIIPMENCNL